MEEISILLTEPEPRGTLPPLRKCNVERKEPSGGGYSVPPRKCRVSLVVTSASFLGTVVSMRLVAMARTSSPVAWPSFLTDLAKIYVAFFAIIEAINMLLEWCDGKFVVYTLKNYNGTIFSSINFAWIKSCIYIMPPLKIFEC